MEKAFSKYLNDDEDDDLAADISSRPEAETSIQMAVSLSAAVPPESAVRERRSMPSLSMEATLLDEDEFMWIADEAHELGGLQGISDINVETSVSQTNYAKSSQEIMDIIDHLLDQTEYRRGHWRLKEKSRLERLWVAYPHLHPFPWPHAITIIIPRPILGRTPRDLESDSIIFHFEICTLLFKSPIYKY